MRASPAILPGLLFLLASCGGGGDSGGGGTTGPTTASSVSMNRSSATLRVAEVTTITASARDASGGALAGRSYAWTIAPTGIAAIAASGASVQVTGSAVGDATLTVTVDGKQANTAIHVTNDAFPLTADVAVSDNQFTPAAVDVAVGATVAWTWASGSATHNVTFSGGPAAVATIANRNSGGESRTFNTVGTYPYRCTLHAGMSATVTVH